MNPGFVSTEGFPNSRVPDPFLLKPERVARGHRHRYRAGDRSRVQHPSMGGHGTSLPRPDAAALPLGDGPGHAPLWRHIGG